MVAVLNRAFSPSDEEVDKAERIIRVYEQAQANGTGAISLDGKMVDVPVALRAEKLLARYRRIQERSG